MKRIIVLALTTCLILMPRPAQASVTVNAEDIAAGTKVTSIETFVTTDDTAQLVTLALAQATTGEKTINDNGTITVRQLESRAYFANGEMVENIIKSSVALFDENGHLMDAHRLRSLGNRIDLSKYDANSDGVLEFKSEPRLQASSSGGYGSVSMTLSSRFSYSYRRGTLGYYDVPYQVRIDNTSASLAGSDSHPARASNLQLETYQTSCSDRRYTYVPYLYNTYSLSTGYSSYVPLTDALSLNPPFTVCGAIAILHFTNGVQVPLYHDGGV